MKKILLSVLAVALSVTVSFAGDLSFVFTERVSYDDNIYFTNEDTESSMISTTKLGLNYESLIPSTNISLKAGILGGYNYYMTDPSVNSYFDALVYVSGEHDYFNVSNTFLFTSDPANSALTERAERINNTTDLYFISSRDKDFAIGIGGKNTYDSYIKEEFDYLSRNRIDALVDLFYTVMPKTRLFVNYTHSIIDYSKNEANNSSGDSIGLGIKGDLSERITALAKVSYDMRDYANDKVDSLGNVAENETSLVGYLVSVKWDPTYSTSLTLSGNRAAQETLYDLNRYYISTSVSLYASQKIYDKYSASVLGSYEDMAYPIEIAGSDVLRNDEFLRVRPAVEMEIFENGKIAVFYEYSTRTSNIEVFEYVNNSTGIEFKFAF
ncbi:MAG: outer membrane beta-barrel protein [Endomicrobia bacterium]|nr:outer membrane beta-barrel protein [Endomicrobiia bacterium]MCL2798770.1 outer membrane beta-barrel protein [Endomicrobiia bacterium]